MQDEAVQLNKLLQSTTSIYEILLKNSDLHLIPPYCKLLENKSK